MITSTRLPWSQKLLGECLYLLGSQRLNNRLIIRIGIKSFIIIIIQYVQPIAVLLQDFRMTFQQVILCFLEIFLTRAYLGKPVSTHCGPIVFICSHLAGSVSKNICNVVLPSGKGEILADTPTPYVPPSFSRTFS